MAQHLSAVTLVVPDYDRALDFYVGTLGFDLVEDTNVGPGKRWVLVAPPGSDETRMLLARAERPSETAAIGNQTGGRVFLFLSTDDFARDHARMREAGVTFTEAPRREAYGRVAVFTDLFGNRWDLIEPAGGTGRSRSGRPDGVARANAPADDPFADVHRVGDNREIGTAMPTSDTTARCRARPSAPPRSRHRRLPRRSPSPRRAETLATVRAELAGRSASEDREPT